MLHLEFQCELRLILGRIGCRRAAHGARPAAGSTARRPRASAGWSRSGEGRREAAPERRRRRFGGRRGLVHEYHHEVPFVVGADGHRSLVRRQLGIDYGEAGPSHLFGVFEFEAEPPVRNEVRVVFTDETTSVLWPLPDGRCRWSFQMKADGVELDDVHFKSRLLVQSGQDYFPHLTRELLVNLITERAPWFTTIPGEVFWSALVRFESRLATGFGQDRIWLAGDAAHMTGPVGVQSMNVGLREANRLAEKIEEVQRGAYPLSRISLYEDEFRSEWQQLLGLGGGLVAGPKADDWVASNRHRILPCMPASGRDIGLLAEQIGLGFSRTELTGAA